MAASTKAAEKRAMEAEQRVLELESAVWEGRRGAPLSYPDL
jgi:hypothetical protein